MDCKKYRNRSKVFLTAEKDKQADIIDIFAFQCKIHLAKLDICKKQANMAINYWQNGENNIYFTWKVGM